MGVVIYEAMKGTEKQGTEMGSFPSDQKKTSGDAVETPKNAVTDGSSAIKPRHRTGVGPKIPSVLYCILLHGTYVITL